MRKAFKIISVFGFFIFFILNAGATKALAAGGTGITGLVNRITTNKDTSYTAILDLISQIINQVINLVLYIIPSVALIMTIWSGIQYMLSAGNPTKQADAIKSLNASILGFAAFLMLLAIWTFIKAFFGIKL